MDNGTFNDYISIYKDKNDEEIIDFENDLNDMIKEYNQNEMHSLGETNINYAK